MFPRKGQFIGHSFVLHAEFDIHFMFMHDICMATKTISLELDAYEKLRRARRTPSESFSSVVRRAEFPGSPKTAAELSAILENRMKEDRLFFSESELDRLDEAQKNARASGSEWDNA